jgi:hypothetical protein
MTSPLLPRARALLAQGEQTITNVHLDRVERLAVDAAKDRDTRWDAMLDGGPLNPERIDQWSVTSSPSGEPICSLTSEGHWPTPGLARVASLAEYIAAVPPATTIAITSRLYSAEQAAASLCTALEASEAEAGRLRGLFQSADLAESGLRDKLATAHSQRDAAIAERDKLRALLVEACDIGERIERDSGNWRPTDRTRLATIRTEALK